MQEEALPELVMQPGRCTVNADAGSKASSDGQKGGWPSSGRSEGGEE